MVARRELRRRAFYDRLFLPPDNPGAGEVDPGRQGFEVRLSRPGVLPNGQVLAKLFDGNDELLIHPRRITVDTGAPDIESAVQEAGFRPGGHEPSDERGVRTFELRAEEEPDDAKAARRVVAIVARLHDQRRAISPQYAAVTSQTTHPSEDAELVAYVARPDPGDPCGSGLRVCVLDTGLSSRCPWTIGNGRFLPQGDNSDALIGATPGKLGFAAGHGSFVAGLIHQLVPSADIEVRHVATPDGVVLESTLLTVLSGMVAATVPDVLVLPFGGYGLSTAFGTGGGQGGDWVSSVALLDALEALVAVAPGLLVVASAGNDDTSDPCFPAAYAASRFGGEALSAATVSVAGVDCAGYRALFSNFGDWVTAAALGVRLRSAFVVGCEDPANDPDGSPETWTHPAYARWSGTSFAAPLVAAAVIRQQWELQVQQGIPVTAREAWTVVSRRSGKAADMVCPWVDDGGVAHD